MKKLFTFILVTLLATTVAWASNFYVKVTNPETQLEAGKKYILATEAKVMATTTNTTFTGNAYSSENDVIDFDQLSKSSLEFTLGGNSDDGWTFAYINPKDTNQTLFLALKEKNGQPTNGLRSLTENDESFSSYAKWTIEEDTGNGYIVKQAGRIIGQSNINYSFACTATLTYYAYLYVKMPESSLEVSTTELNLGTNESGTFTVTGENLIKDVTLTLKDGSDEGFSLSQETINLVNHGVEETEITVSYNGVSPIATATIIVKSGNISKEVTVTYESQGLNVSTDALELGASTSGSFTVSGQSLLTDISISLKEGSDEGFSVTPEIIEITDGSVGETEVTVSYTGMASKATAYVQVASGDAIKEVVVTVDIPRTLEVSTDNLNMGYYNSASFTLSGNYLAADVTIKVKDGSDPGFTVTPTNATIVDGTLADTEVTVSYDGLADASATIIITSGTLTKEVNVTAQAFTIYIDKTSTGYFYAWNSEGEPNAESPGVEIVAANFEKSATVDGVECYVYRFNGEAAGLSFSGENNQTESITPEKGKVYKYISGNKWCTTPLSFALTETSTGYIYVWDENESNENDKYEPLGAMPGTPMEHFDMGALVRPVTVDIRVSSVNTTYKAYVIFNDGNENQTEKLELIAGKVYSFPVEEGIEINEVNFPDPIFRQYVHDKFDKNNSWWLTQDELEVVTTMNLYVSSNAELAKITDFTGIEYFTNLKTFFFAGTSSNKLVVETLDMSSLTNLESFTCRYGSNLTEVNVSGCTNLTYIQLMYQDVITGLDLTSNNKMAEIVVEDCPQFAELSIPTPLETLEKLSLRNCASFSGQTLDLTGDNNLYSLVLWQLGNKNHIIGVCKDMTGLEYLVADYNTFEGNMLDLTGCKYLYNLSVVSCGLNEILLNGCTNLGTKQASLHGGAVNQNPQFTIHSNRLRALDLTGVKGGLDGTEPRNYNYNLSSLKTSEGTMLFPEEDYIIHTGYNGQATPVPLQADVALDYIEYTDIYHSAVKSYTYLVYLRLDENNNDPAENGGTILNRFNTLAHNDGFSGESVNFDYKRVKLWTRFAYNIPENKGVISSNPEIAIVHGTRSNNAPRRLEGHDTPNASAVYGDILSLGMYTVSPDSEEIEVSGTVSYMYDTRSNDHNGGTVDNPDSQILNSTAERDYYKSLTLNETGDAIEEEYNNMFPFEIKWEATLSGNPEQVITGIDKVSEVAPFAEVTYYNVMGVASHKPFEGVNIVVTRYSDGTTTTQKVIR